MFSCKQGQTSCSNITKKMFWWIIFVIITKIVTKIIVPRNYFVIISARMVHNAEPPNPYKNSTKPRDTPLQNPETHHYKTSTKPPEQNLYKTSTKPLQNPHYKTSTKPPRHTTTKPLQNPRHTTTKPLQNPRHTTTKPLQNYPHHKTSTKPLKHYKIRGSEGFVEVFCATHKKPLQNPPNPLFCSVLGVL